MLPWRPFSLLVVFLALVDVLLHWPLISRFFSCSTSRSFICMRRNVLVRWHQRPWDIRILYWYHISSQAMIRVMYIWHLCILHHRSIVYLVMAMVIFLLQIHNVCLVAALVMIHFIMDPHYISHGYDLVCWVLHRSTVYLWQLFLVIISEYIWQLVRGFFGIGLMVVTPHHMLPPPPHRQYYCIKYFGHHTCLLTSNFRGHLLHSKMPPSFGKKS